jgi:tetratricopeptide (TPR) repeat protein
LPTLAANRGTEPAKLTKLVRGELDWIVMKALEKDRNRRYETANGFAMDLQRYLADEPVLACPPSVRYRLRKLVMRNRSLVLAASVVVLCLVAGIITTSSGLIWAMRERNNKGRALIAETTAKENEKQVRDRAMAALRDMTDDVVYEQMARSPSLTEENKEYLRKIIRHFEGLATVTADDAESRSIREEGLFRVGRMRHVLGELKEAETAYRESLALLKQLAAEFPAVPLHRRRLGLNYNQLGNVLRDTGRFDEAEMAFADGLAVLLQVAAEAGATPGVRQDLAGCYRNQASLFRATGRFEKSELAFKAALDFGNGLVAEFGSVPEFRHDLAGTYGSLGNLLRETGRLNESEKSFDAALAIQRQLVNEFPNRPLFRKELAGSLNNFGVLLELLSRTTQIEEVFSEALAVKKKLAADFPIIPEFRQDLALGFSNLGNHLTDLKKAESALLEALELRKQLAEDFPERPEFRRELAGSHINLGALLSKTGRSDQAVQEFTEAVTIQKKLADEFPKKPDYHQEMAASYFNLAEEYRNSRELPKALAAFRDALAIQKKLADNFPNYPEYRDQLAGSHNNLGVMLTKMGKRTEAQAEYRQSLEIKEKLVADFPKVPSYAVYLGGGYCNYGNMVRDDGQIEAALEWYQKAIAVLEPVAALKLPPVNARMFLRNSLFSRAVVLNRLDRHTEATRDWKRVVELHDGPEVFPRWKLVESRMRMAHQNKDSAGCLAAAADYEALKPSNLFGSACSRALCAAALLQDPKIPAVAADRLANEQAERAMAWLQKAVVAGFRDVECLKKENDLNALRQRADFKKLLTELEARKK